MEAKLNEVLNIQIANWSILFVKLHNYHWLIKGSDFFILHEKFEEFYDEAAVHIDELAERLLAIGGEPIATMKQYLEISSVQESKGNETSEHMVQIISDDFTHMIVQLKEGISIAEEAGDDGTGDMFLGIRSNLEKHVWMLKAFLGK